MKSTIIVSATAFATLLAIATPSMARHELEQSGAQAIPLSDGSIMYVFKDGKMAVEDKYGRAMTYKPGRSFEAKDGRTVVGTSSESARLNTLLTRGHGGS